MQPRGITREMIEALNESEPNCFETDREEQWFNVGLKYGLDVADANPKSPWISVEVDLPCNHEDMYQMSGSLLYTDDVLVLAGNMVLVSRRLVTCMMFDDSTGKWKWNTPFHVKHWMRIPKLEEE